LNIFEENSLLILYNSFERGKIMRNQSLFNELAKDRSNNGFIKGYFLLDNHDAEAKKKAALELQEDGLIAITVCEVKDNKLSLSGKFTKKGMEFIQ
jgi:hypothetical protein